LPLRYGSPLIDYRCVLLLVVVILPPLPPLFALRLVTLPLRYVCWLLPFCITFVRVVTERYGSLVLRYVAVTDVVHVTVAPLFVTVGLPLRVYFGCYCTFVVVALYSLLTLLLYYVALPFTFPLLLLVDCVRVLRYLLRWLRCYD